MEENWRIPPSLPIEHLSLHRLPSLWLQFSVPFSVIQYEYALSMCEESTLENAVLGCRKWTNETKEIELGVQMAS
jgi:hypothetical protein